MSTARSHLSASHSLAQVVRDRCKEQHRRAGGLVGQVGCGICWEWAIRADERAIVEHGLAGDAAWNAEEPYVDWTAIEKYRAGEAGVSVLNHDDRVAILRELLATNPDLTVSAIASRTRIAEGHIYECLAQLAAEHRPEEVPAALAM